MCARDRRALVSPLHAVHEEAGGRFVTFAGWRLPVHYGSILDEARPSGRTAGMFDVSHMGRMRMRGPDALAILQTLGTNDLDEGRAGQSAVHAVVHARRRHDR